MKIKTHNDLKKALESKCTIAIENACDRLLEKLKQYINEEYYSKFDPKEYVRTNQFYNSAVKEMLTDTCGQIFMNPDKMDYPWNGTGWMWSGEFQIVEANKGIHGGWSTPTSEHHHYWDEFKSYYEKNAVIILKEELRKQGLVIK